MDEKPAFLLRDMDGKFPNDSGGPVIGKHVGAGAVLGIDIARSPGRFDPGDDRVWAAIEIDVVEMARRSIVCGDTDGAIDLKILQNQAGGARRLYAVSGRVSGAAVSDGHATMQHSKRSPNGGVDVQILDNLSIRIRRDGPTRA